MMKAEGNLQVQLCGLEVDITAPGFTRREAAGEAILADELKIIIEGTLLAGQVGRVQVSPMTGCEIYYSETPAELAREKMANIGLSMEVIHVLLLNPCEEQAKS